MLRFGELSFKIVFLTRNKQTVTLQRQPNHPCAFVHLFKKQIERFDVAVKQSLRQTGN